MIAVINLILTNYFQRLLIKEYISVNKVKPITNCAGYWR